METGGTRGGVRGVAETIWDVAGQRACKLRMRRREGEEYKGDRLTVPPLDEGETRCS